jgi:hypothetical protein
MNEKPKKRIQHKEKNSLDNPKISKLYVLAFAKPKTDYQLSIEFYGKIKRRRIMDIIQDCNYLFTMKKIPTKSIVGYKWSIQSKINPLIEIIDSIIYSKFKTPLNSEQRKTLNQILNNKLFRSTITINSNIKNHEMIIAIIGTIASITYSTKNILLPYYNNLKQHKNEYNPDILINQMITGLKQIDPTYKKIENPIELSNQIIQISQPFLYMDLNFLFKLSQISPISQYTHYAIESTYIFTQLINSYLQQ